MTYQCQNHSQIVCRHHLLCIWGIDTWLIIWNSLLIWWLDMHDEYEIVLVGHFPTIYTFHLSFNVQFQAPNITRFWTKDKWLNALIWHVNTDTNRSYKQTFTHIHTRAHTHTHKPHTRTVSEECWIFGAASTLKVKESKTDFTAMSGQSRKLVFESLLWR